MSSRFTRAERKQSKGRLAIDGQSGAGKTWTALAAATILADGGKIAVIDTEGGSARKFADTFAFDVSEVAGYDRRGYHPDVAIDLLSAAAHEGYSVVVIDSLSHFYAGKGGVLMIVDEAARTRFRGNSHAAWSVGSPLWIALLDAITTSPMHVVATLRTRTRWVEDSKGKPERAGAEPVAREGVEYEFDLVLDIDRDHYLKVAKSRVRGGGVVLPVDATFRAGETVADILGADQRKLFEDYAAWLAGGAVDTAARARELIALGGGDKKAVMATLKELGVESSTQLDDDDLFERCRGAVTATDDGGAG